MSDPVHCCQARGCMRTIPTKLLMCSRHWRMVPQKIQNDVWRTYRPGQEEDLVLSEEYQQAYNAAVGAVAKLEGRL